MFVHIAYCRYCRDQRERPKPQENSHLFSRSNQTTPPEEDSSRRIVTDTVSLGKRGRSENEQSKIVTRDGAFRMTVDPICPRHDRPCRHLQTESGWYLLDSRRRIDQHLIFVTATHRGVTLPRVSRPVPKIVPGPKGLCSLSLRESGSFSDHCEFVQDNLPREMLLESKSLRQKIKESVCKINRQMNNMTAKQKSEGDNTHDEFSKHHISLDDHFLLHCRRHLQLEQHAVAVPPAPQSQGDRGFVPF
ncbi:hypothetical protein BLNAU_17032 [Blattamonas nauphoetae]|uniref:Uncharacterized protein n=1 Tax=Blattamonas nauphoetae TaxID=2049346 RepID=A0ABQ9XCH9_9EUKA|nr:hypothetical protein BLNAU_17032 [Blattamonas nauphoetae]